MKKHMSILVSAFSVAVLSAVPANESRSESAAGETSGSLSKAQQQIQQLGAEAAKKAQQAEAAAQKAESMANKLSGQEQTAAKNDAREARDKADEAKTTSDRIQQGERSGRVDDAQQAMGEVKEKGEAAERQADKVMKSGQ